MPKHSIRRVTAHARRADRVIERSRAAVTMPVPIVDRQAFTDARADIRARVIDAYRDLYGPEFTDAAEAVWRAGWDAEDVPPLVLVSDRPAAPGAVMAITAGDEDAALDEKWDAFIRDSDDPPEWEERQDDEALDLLAAPDGDES